MTNLILGDCIEKLKELPDNSVDSIVTDPPYGLGFMGKKWDELPPGKEVFAECLRVLKPGGHLLSFGGTRTYHRMAVAIEDAGFEVRDMIEWVYGSGFPKSLNIGKAVDKRGGTTSDQSKEFAEYIKNRRNELSITLSKADEVICGGTTNYSWFEGRPAGQRLPRKTDYLKMKELLTLDDRYDGFMEETEREVVGKGTSLALPISQEFDGWGEKKEFDITKGTSEFEGWGTALKPSHEPICMARKPLAEKTVSENCLKWGTGGINIDESRVGTSDNLNGGAYSNNRETSTNKVYGEYQRIKDDFEQPQGRFPANLIHDNSEEVRECFPDAGGGKYKAPNARIRNNGLGLGTTDNRDGSSNAPDNYGDSGNASRFFKSIIYNAKASKSERNKGCEGLEEKEAKITGMQSDQGMKVRMENGIATGLKAPPKKATNNHPTVKPIALMEYLIKMVTPKGGTVLDPFMGSGSTGVAAKKNGYDFIGIELSPEYIEIAKARIESKE